MTGDFNIMVGGEVGQGVQSVGAILAKTLAYGGLNVFAALIKAQEWGDRIPIGIIFKQERPVYEEQLPQLKEMPLVKQPIDPLKIERLMGEF
jgi:hypothetical protein